VVLVQVRAGLVEVRTVNGPITYRGPLPARARYRFGTHDGRVTVAIPDSVPVTLTVDRFHAPFVSNLERSRAITDSTRGDDAVLVARYH